MRFNSACKYWLLHWEKLPCSLTAYKRFPLPHQKYVQGLTFQLQDESYMFLLYYVWRANTLCFSAYIAWFVLVPLLHSTQNWRHPKDMHHKDRHRHHSICADDICQQEEIRLYENNLVKGCLEIDVKHFRFITLSVCSSPHIMCMGEGGWVKERTHPFASMDNCVDWGLNGPNGVAWAWTYNRTGTKLIRSLVKG